MTLLARSRQAELVDDTILSQPITIIGCGAIGSFTALTLAKMGFHNLVVHDHDDVAEENISNQFYRHTDIGTNKALALSNMIEDFEGITINYVACAWTHTTPLERTVIMAVDSMVVRHLIYDRIKVSRGVYNFIDGRMGGQQAEIYAFDNVTEQRVMYEKYLWAEDEAEDMPCTRKAVMYNVLWIASGIANTLRLMLQGESYSKVTYMDFVNQLQSNIDV